MMGGFRYTEQERTAIAEIAPKLSATDWQELESLAGTCPVLLPRAKVARIKQTSAKLSDLLETLPGLIALYGRVKSRRSWFRFTG
jgi:hypothetical protein